MEARCKKVVKKEGRPEVDCAIAPVVLSRSGEVVQDQVESRCRAVAQRGRTCLGRVDLTSNPSILNFQ